MSYTYNYEKNMNSLSIDPKNSENSEVVASAEPVEPLYDSIRMMQVDINKHYKEAKENDKVVKAKLCRHDLQVLSKAQKDMEMMERDYKLAINNNEEKRMKDIYGQILRVKSEAFRKLHLDILASKDSDDDLEKHDHCKHCNHSRNHSPSSHSRDSRDRDTDRDRGRDRDTDRDRGRDNDRSRDRDNDRERSRYNDRDRERYRDRDHDLDRDRKDRSPRKTRSSSRRRPVSSESRGHRRTSFADERRSHPRFTSPSPGDSDPYYYQRKYAGENQNQPQTTVGSYPANNGPFDPHFYRKKYRYK